MRNFGETGATHLTEVHFRLEEQDREAILNVEIIEARKELNPWIEIIQGRRECVVRCIERDLPWILRRGRPQTG